jgi:hypothetical protein
MTLGMSLRLEDLPTELLLKIAKYLEVSDVFSIRQVGSHSPADDD